MNLERAYQHHRREDDREEDCFLDFRFLMTVPFSSGASKKHCPHLIGDGLGKGRRNGSQRVAR